MSPGHPGDIEHLSFLLQLLLASFVLIPAELFDMLMYILTVTSSLCSAHLCALPDRGLCVRGLHPGGLRGRCVLLPLPEAQAGAVIRGRNRKWVWQRATPGDHPHDGQHQHLQGLVIASVQHGNLVQLLRPGCCAPPHRPRPDASAGLLLLAPRRQRLRQHAHQLLRAQLSAGHADHASSRTVPAPTVHRLCPPRVPSRRLPGRPGRVQTPPIPLPSTHQWIQCHR